MLHLPCRWFFFLTALLAFAVVPACGAGDSDAGEPLDLLAGNYELVYLFDAEAFREGEAPRQIRTALSETEETLVRSSLVSGYFREQDAVLDSITMAWSGRNSLRIEKGTFNFDRYRDSIDQLGYAIEPNQDLEIWKTRDGQFAQGIIENHGYLLMGETILVKQALQQKSSIWDTEIGVVLDKIGIGWIVYAYECSRVLYIPECDIVAWSLAAGNDEDIAQIKWAFLHENEGESELSASEVEEWLEDFPMLYVQDVVENGITIIATTSIYVGDFDEFFLSFLYSFR